MTFTPALSYRDPMAALAWLEKAFGFETCMLIEPPDGDMKMMHAEMSFEGDGRIMVGECGHWIPVGQRRDECHVDTFLMRE